MQHAYTSLNKALRAAWGTIAPGSLVTIVEPGMPDPPPNEGLRIKWEHDGIPTRIPGEYIAQIDLAIIVPAVAGKPARNVALSRGRALDQAIGFQGSFDCNGGDGTGRLERWDYTVTPARALSEMELISEGGWEMLASGSPGQICRARTVLLRFRTNTGAAFG
jgi:hypothetical protein